MTKKEKLQKLFEENPWANLAFLYKYIDKRKKEQDIIDSFYELYSFYPEFLSAVNLCKEYDQKEEIERNFKRKGTINSALVGTLGLTSAQIMGINPNLISLLGTLLIISGGSKAIYELNKKEIKDKIFTKKEKKETLKKIKNNFIKFDTIKDNYSLIVLDYVYDYYLDSDIDWLKELKRIINDNNEYIERKKEENEFKKDFNVTSITNIHNIIFDIDLFNEAIHMIREMIESNKNEEKVLKNQ